MKRLRIRTFGLVILACAVFAGCGAAIANAAPVASSLSPSTANAGGGAFTLTINGSGFNSRAVVLWNGTQRATKFINSTQLRASILNGDIATAGSAAVSVMNWKKATSNALTFTINAAAASPLAITTTSLPNGTVNSPYATTLAASGGTPPYSWSVTSGQLPAGLTLSASGNVSGTPTASGTYSFAIQAKDSATSPQLASKTYSMAVAAAAPAPIAITTGPLPEGTVSSPYSATMSATGGTPPYTWGVISGQLPAGLTLSPSGTLSGTPTASGTFSPTVQVKDSATSPQAATQSDSIVIAAASASTCAGTCYYVSPSGSDSNLGTSPSTPWRTLAKVQNFQANLQPGDSVLLQRGGVWYEQLDITNMKGSSGLPITISSYGTGNLPVIDGGQTSSTAGRNYCIDAMNTTFQWITVDGIECRNAYKQGITFKVSDATRGVNGVGIVVQNSYVHHDGAGACTSCANQPTPDPGGYLNQLDAQHTTGVKFLNNTLDHLGGHNALQVHYDLGNAEVTGNRVGTQYPWYNHNGIDVKGGPNTLVSNNYVTCPTCGGAAFYTENTMWADEHITFIGNIANNNYNAIQITNGGTCTAAPCSITAKVYNNTIYNPNYHSLLVSGSCTNISFDIQKNIFDGDGNVSINSSCASAVTWDYNDDGGAHGPITGNPVGIHDLKQVNPQYLNDAAGNFTPQNSTILSDGANDPVTSFRYLGALGK